MMNGDDMSATPEDRTLERLLSARGPGHANPLLVERIIATAARAPALPFDAEMLPYTIPLRPSLIAAMLAIGFVLGVGSFLPIDHAHITATSAPVSYSEDESTLL